MRKVTFIIIVLGLGYYFSQSFLSSNQEDPKEVQADHDHTKNKDIKTNPKSDSRASDKDPKNKIKSPVANHDSHDHGNSNEDFEIKVVDIPRDEAGESLLDLAEITSTFANREVDVEALKETLTKRGLEVVSTVDSNPYTGSLTVIRTNNSLPGTRYFHAQIFTDENNKDFVQHMSYEYRPSENAFAEAVAAAKKTFGLTKVADVRKDGFYSWNTDDGYIIWVKRMEKEDLKNDPFNAYTDADIGTVRTAKELEIH